MYNIEENSLKVLIDKSNGICAICKNKVKLFIDHDHINKKFRGLICHKCNTGLGMFCDNVDYLKEAIKYLKKSKK